jgi:hypothetical protein
MVTFDQNPSLLAFVMFKVNRALAKRQRVREDSTRAPALFFSIVRLLCHLGAFSALTIAGFTWTFIAGMVTLAICLLVFSALFTADRGTQ